MDAGRNPECPILAFQREKGIDWLAGMTSTQRYNSKRNPPRSVFVPYIAWQWDKTMELEPKTFQCGDAPTTQESRAHSLTNATKCHGFKKFCCETKVETIWNDNKAVCMWKMLLKVCGRKISPDLLCASQNGRKFMDKTSSNRLCDRKLTFQWRIACSGFTRAYTRSRRSTTIGCKWQLENGKFE